ncbi:hypothetical protein BC567DRAFT_13645 [Phyllosticta citribraziliensis]
MVHASSQPARGTLPARGNAGFGKEPTVRHAGEKLAQTCSTLDVRVREADSSMDGKKLRCRMDSSSRGPVIFR